MTNSHSLLCLVLIKKQLESYHGLIEDKTTRQDRASSVAPTSTAQNRGSNFL